MRFFTRGAAAGAAALALLGMASLSEPAAASVQKATYVAGGGDALTFCTTAANHQVGQGGCGFKVRAGSVMSVSIVDAVKKGKVNASIVFSTAAIGGKSVGTAKICGGHGALRVPGGASYAFVFVPTVGFNGTTKPLCGSVNGATAGTITVND